MPQPTLAQYAAAQFRAELARGQISDVEFARRIGTSSDWVARRRRGDYAISLNDLERIAAGLDLPVSFFFPIPERSAA